MSKLIHYSGPAGSYLLPSGYTRLTYIQSTGSLWVDLGIVPSNMSCYGEFIPLSNNPAMVFGASGNTIWGTYSLDFYKDNYIYIKNIQKVTGTVGNKYSFYYTPTAFYVNGTNYSGTYSCTGSSSLTLFKSSSRYSNIKLYKFVLTNVNGEAVRNMIPVQITASITSADGTSCSSGSIGLLDLVENKFYLNKGTGTFIAGPECPQGFPTSEYCLVEWLKIPNGTYYNSGLNINSGDVVKTDAVMWYEIGGSGRDLTGWSSNGANYWGVTASGTWENVTGSNSDITKRLSVTYQLTATSAGYYHIGALAGYYMSRHKYIERFTISIGEVIKRDMIPCYRRSDMMPGFYDIAGRNFYTATGSGIICTGPSITFGYGEVVNCAGKNLYPNSTSRTISVGSSSLTDRVSNLGFNGITGPWTISFDAVATANVNVFLDICDRGYKSITITPTKLHFSVTATAENYYTPTNYNGFWDITTNGPNGTTITITNIMMLRGNIDTGYVPNVNLSAIPHNISTGDGRMGQKNGSFYFNGTDGCIEIGNLNTILGGNNPYTFSVKFKVDSLGSKGWGTFLGGPSGFEISSRYGSIPAIAPYSWGGSTDPGAGNRLEYQLGRWYTLVHSRTTSNSVVYLIDDGGGVEKKTYTAGSIPSGTYYLGSWRDEVSLNFKGYMQDFLLWDEALTEELILQQCL